MLHFQSNGNTFQVPTASRATTRAAPRSGGVLRLQEVTHTRTALSVATPQVFFRQVTTSEGVNRTLHQKGPELHALLYPRPSNHKDQDKKDPPYRTGFHIWSGPSGRISRTASSCSHSRHHHSTCHREDRSFLQTRRGFHWQLSCHAHLGGKVVTRCCAEEVAVRTLPGSCWYSNISFTLLQTMARETSCWEDQGLLQSSVTGYPCLAGGEANTAISSTERNRRTETTCRQEIKRKS